MASETKVDNRTIIAERVLRPFWFSATLPRVLFRAAVALVVLASISAAQDSITHKAVSLLLPDLQPSLTCNYTEVFGSVSYPGASSQRNTSLTDLSRSCPELVKLADSSSVKDIYHTDRALSRVAQQLRFGCQIEDLGVGERFALYVCIRTHLTWYDTEKITALSFSVVSVADRKEVLRVPRRLKGTQSAILVPISGEDYLVVLEDGVNLILYRL